MEVQRRLGSRPAAGAARFPVSLVGRVALALALLVALTFGVRSHARARLWSSETRLLLDAVAHYPDGGTAAFFRARSAAQVGNVTEAIAELRDAERKNAARFTLLLTDPGLAPIRPHPDFQVLVGEMAGHWIERAYEKGVATQPEYRVVGLAHQVRSEYALAVRAFESALEVGGPQDELVRSELENVRGKLAGGGGKEP
jgi:tetratricopeptide (TPR) repeat protein